MTDEPEIELYKAIEADKHGDHQLLPVTGGRYRQVMKGYDDIGDLAVDVEPVGDKSGKILVQVHSGWKPSADQALQLEAGAHVRVTLWMYPTPPMAVSVEPPICSCHKAPMAWDEEDCGYFCASQERAVPSSAEALKQAQRDFHPETEVQRKDAG